MLFRSATFLFILGEMSNLGTERYSLLIQNLHLSINLYDKLRMSVFEKELTKFIRKLQSSPGLMMGNEPVATDNLLKS